MFGRNKKKLLAERAERAEMEQKMGSLLLAAVPEPEPEPAGLQPLVLDAGRPGHWSIDGQAGTPAATPPAYNPFALLDVDMVVSVLLHLPAAGMVQMALVCRLFGQAGQSTGQSLCEHAAATKAQHDPNHALFSGRDEESSLELLSAMERCVPGARAVASAKHTVLISADGQQCLTCGNGDAGRLGHGLPATLTEGLTTLEAVPGLPPVVQVAAGAAHSAALDTEGKLWTFGWGDSGRLGHGVVLDELMPRVVESLRHVRLGAISAGGAHTAAVSADGALYEWGVLGEHDEEQLEPVQVDTHGAAISLVACGGGTTACVSRDGSLYVRGHLVQTLDLRLLASPTPAWLSPTSSAVLHSRPMQLDVISACVGGGSSAKTTGDWLAVCTRSGGLYTLGSGAFGALGHGTDDGEEELRRVDYFAENGLWVQSVSAGSTHAAAIAHEGQVFTWGRGKYGRLGLGDRDDRMVPTLVEAFSAVATDYVACGREHTVFGLSSGDVYTAGRGDDGRLGTGGTSRQSLPRRLRNVKLIPAPVAIDHVLEVAAVAALLLAGDDADDFVADDEDVV